MTEEEKDAYIKKLLTSNIDQHNKISFLSAKVQALQKQNGELKAQVEKMKCCGNCIYQGECDLSGYEECKNFDKWELRR